MKSTLYQVSTSSAIVEGIYEGAVKVATMKKHGNLGLGTFENLDGEMVVIDGAFYQVKSDGSVNIVSDDVLTPFATVTHFKPDSTSQLQDCPNLASLSLGLDKLRHTDNYYFALRVDGSFDQVLTRAMCRTAEGIPLAKAAVHQPEFKFKNVRGTIVGFWTPEYAKTLNVPGYHMHFLSDDRTCGGHILECSGRDLKLQIEREGDFRIVLPENNDFVKADFREDSSAELKHAEFDHK